MPDNTRLKLHLEQDITCDCVHSLEPTVESTVEDHIPSSGECAAPDGEALLDSPFLCSRCSVPGDELSPVAARAGFHGNARADERRSLNVIDLESFVVHAQIIRGHVEE